VAKSLAVLYTKNCQNRWTYTTELQSVNDFCVFLWNTKCKEVEHFLEVVQLHILDVVDNVIHHFVENLTGFPAVKNCENWPRLVKVNVTRGWHFFWDTV